MPTTTYSDAAFGVRDIGARTDPDGGPVGGVDDLSAEEDRLINSLLSEGWLSGPDAFEVTPTSPASMTVEIGSGAARADRYVVPGGAVGQHPYIVQLNETVVAQPLAASDAQSRTDEIYLVVLDDAYDSTQRGLPRIGYRRGDAGLGAPGPDPAWVAYALLATVPVPAGATETTAVTGARKQALIAAGAHPVGAVMDFAGQTSPPGWLLCDGAVISRATYRALFEAIGTTFGAGDGTTTFRIPDMRGRVAIGAGSLGTDTYVRGGTGGSARVTLTEAQVPAHSHTTPNHSHTVNHKHGSGTLGTGTTGSGHTHGSGTLGADNGGAHSHAASSDNASYRFDDWDGSTRKTDNSGLYSVIANVSQRLHNHAISVTTTNSAHAHGVSGKTNSTGSGHTHNVTGSTADSNPTTSTAAPTTHDTGGGGSHENRQPYLALNSIIFAGA